ncbi:tape measure protein [Methylomagnum ishizawai]|uniref:tape measure protein n=1 Tax=Methylomagnum ishizawai TaxID=1760988 RepID=UPI001C3364BB|nr:tape measure protein [Methylomagnum ishizawai]BBL75573.1 hypothetical protein MishRS11D_26710 [Methylomagnum ishizawai]
MADRRVKIGIAVEGAASAKSEVQALEAGVQTLSQTLKDQSRAATAAAQSQAGLSKAVDALTVSEARLKTQVADTQARLAAAQAASATRQSALDTAGGRADSLGIQTALAKKALADLAAHGVAPTHVEYQALAGQIQIMEADLKRSLSTVKTAQKEYDSAARETAKLEAEYKRLSTAADQAGTELAAQRANLAAATAESARLEKQAQATAQALKAQSSAAATGKAWQGFGTGITAQAQAQQQAAQQHAVQQWVAVGMAAVAAQVQAKQQASQQQQAAKQWSAFGMASDPRRAGAAAIGAREILGIRSSAEIVADIRAVKAAYADLAASGQASLRELARAEQATADKVKALKTELRGNVATPIADSRTTLGIRGGAEIEADIAKVRAAYQTLATSGRASGQELARAQAAARTQVKALRDELAGASQAQKNLNREAGLYGMARNALAGVAVVSTAKQLAGAADGWANLSARLKLATTSQKEFTTAESALFGIAQRNMTSLEETAGLYTKVAGSMRDLGMTQQQGLALTDDIGMALRLSGATATSGAAGIQQFAQALQSGVLRGDEFNSIMENSPRLAKALADGLKVPIGSLRKMAEQGDLTAEKVIKAILSQSEVLRREAASMPTTIGGAWQKIENAALAYIGKADQASGSSAQLAGELSRVADNFSAVADPIMTIARIEVGGFNKFVDLVKDLGDALAKIPKGDFLPDIFNHGLSEDAQAKAYEADLKRMMEKGFGPSTAPSASTVSQVIKPTTDQIMLKVAEAAKKYQVPEAFALAIAKTESGFAQYNADGSLKLGSPTKTGARAVGVMQTMPATAKRYGVDPANVDENIDGGMRYLRNILAKFHGDLRLAAAGYNAGENNKSLEKGVVPNIKETQNYVATVSKYYNEFLAKYPGGLPFEESASRQKEIDNAWEQFKAGIDQGIAASENRARLDESQGRNEIARIEQERAAALEADRAKIDGATRYTDKLKLLEQSRDAQIGYYRQEAAIQRQQVGDEETTLQARRDGIAQQLSAAEQYKLSLSETNRLKAEQEGIDAALKLLAEDRRGIDLDLAAKETSAGQAVIDAKRKEAEYIQGINRELQFQIDLNNQLTEAKARSASKRELGTIKATAESSRTAAESVGAGELPGIQASIAKTQELKAKNEEIAGSVQKVSEEQLRMNAIWDQTLQRQQDYAETWREITGQQHNAFADLSVSIMEYAKQIDQIGAKYKELSTQDPVNEDFYNTQKNTETAASSFNILAKTAVTLRGMYKEGTAGYESMSAAAGAFGAVAQALNIVEGIGAVIHQLRDGDVYTAIPRAVGVAAMVASMGIQTGASGSGSGSGSAALSPTAKTGTGTVFGDSTAQSDSIAQSLDILKQNSSTDLDYSAGMLRALESIDAAMGGVSASIVRGVAPATITQPGQFTNGIGLPAFLDPGMMLTNFLMKRTRTITDYGITADPQQTLSSVLKNGFQGQVYTDIKTETKAFGMTVSSSMKTVFSELDSGVEREFTKTIRSIRDGLVAAGSAFDLGTADFTRRLKGFKIDFGRLSLQGLSGDEITKQVSALFSSESDRMARRFVPGLRQFQAVGEGYFKTLTRVAEGVNRATGELEGLGIAAIDYKAIANKNGDVAAEIVRQSIATAELGSSVGKFIDGATGSAEDLVSAYKSLTAARTIFLTAGLDTSGISRDMTNAAGGVSEFLSSLQTYRDKFLTEGERVTGGWNALAAEFTRFGLKMPTTRQGFRDLVSGIDTSTEAGQKLFGGVITLAGSFDELTASVQSSADASFTAVKDAYSRMKDQAKSWRDYVAGLAVNDPTLSPEAKYRNAKDQFTALLGKARAGDSDAQGKVQGAADTLLAASRDYNASSMAYQSDLAWVKTGLSGLAAQTEGQLSSAERQIQSLDGNTTALQDVAGGLTTLSAALAQYAQDRAAGAAPASAASATDTNAAHTSAAETAAANQPGTVRGVQAVNDANTSAAETQTKREAAALEFQTRIDAAQKELRAAAKEGRKEWRDYWASQVDSIVKEIRESPFNLRVDNLKPKGYRADDNWEVKRLAGGGRVRGPGTGTSDSIPAWLSDGEYVFTADLVRRNGVAALDRALRGEPVTLNADAPAPARFAAGGAVGRVDFRPPSSAAPVVVPAISQQTDIDGLIKVFQTTMTGQRDALQAGIKVDQAGYQMLVKLLTSIDGRLTTLESNNKLAKAM